MRIASRFPLKRRDLQRWSSQGVSAILDQGLFSVSNLVLNVLLARWLPPEEYGAFVAGYTALLLVSVGHSALLSEPMLVFGGDKYAACFSHYWRIVQGYHWRMAFGISAIFVAFAAMLGPTARPLLGEAAAGVALAGPFILLNWLARKGCYTVGGLRWAVRAGVVNLTLIILGIVLLERLHLLSVLSAQLLQGVAAAVAVGLMMVPLSRITSAPLSEEVRASVWQNHWNYGRWSGATGLVNWFNSYFYYFALAAWGGLAATGSLKALLNLVMPILQSDGALVTMLTPALARSRREPGRFTRVTTWSAAGFASEALVYWALLVLFGQRVLEWIYGGTYQFSATVVVLVGLLPVVGGLSNVLATALRAREQPNGVFWATVLSALCVSTVGLFWAARYGVPGALIGLASASVLQSDGHVVAADQVTTGGWRRGIEWAVGPATGQVLKPHRRCAAPLGEGRAAAPHPPRSRRRAESQGSSGRGENDRCSG